MVGAGGRPSRSNLYQNSPTSWLKNVMLSNAKGHHDTDGIAIQVNIADKSS